MSEIIEFKEKIHHIIELFRYIFKEEPIVKKIDRFYEEEIFHLLDKIPDSYLGDINNGLEIGKQIYLSLNLRELNERLEKLPFPITLDLDIYKYAIESIKSNIDDAKIKNGLISIAKKCKPILDCFTFIVKSPLKYLSKLIPETDKLDSLFE